ncbi:PKD domain-containing protein [Bacteroidia bacterium]|nr:PKD domain-containing protein [Bacteroidia bacterium]MDB9882054.1 PKD domain-containing protein [Bacteroidia bacterium]
MKSALSLISFLLLSFMISAQCSIEAWSMKKRIDHSTVIVEGKVINQSGTWDAGQGRIYTLSTIEVYKSFKGNISSSQIVIATEGGRVGLDILQVSPSLELQNGEVGLFLLKNSDVTFTQQNSTLKPTASVQSFVKYDVNAIRAFDYRKTYTSINLELYSEIQNLVGEDYTIIKNFNTESRRNIIKPLSPPVITSFSSSSLISGTSTELTITGSNFGFARGSGKVGFKDANYGDGRYYYSPTSWSYVSWSNSQIKVIVPTRAGTGKVQVFNASGESSESSTDLTVDWSHLNINYPLSASDTPFFELQHVNTDTKGGYTWQMNTNFAGKTAPVASFLRSLEEWRCETQMNWSVGNNTTVDTVLSDNVNMVRFTNFGDSKLGVCYSWYSGCFVGSSDMNWYVKELDIEFDSTYAWYYGTGTPTTFQYDFQSVTTHELGHGHQLGHVRDDSKVMHYSLSNGQRKANLVASDISAGVFIKNKGIAAGVCSKGAMTAIPTNSCNISAPNPNFTISDATVCPGENIQIFSTTEGNVQLYTWMFGEGASPASASTQGPHSISYSTPGTKTIKLITSNNIGQDSISKIIVVKANELDTPSGFSFQDTLCQGEVTYSIGAITNAEDYTWSVGSGGALKADNINSIKVDWQDTGFFTISVFALNECVNGPLQSADIYVLSEPTAAFSENMDGIEVTFTNESTYAESHLWTFGDGGTSSEKSPTYKYADKGDYITKLEAINRCNTAESTKTISLNYNVGLVDVERMPIIYPNPVKNGSEISVNGEVFNTYTLYSVQGKAVKTGNVLNNKILLNVLLPEVYVLSIKNGDTIARYRIQIAD